MRKRHLGLQQLGVRRLRRATHRFVLEPLERRELLAGNLFTVTANTDSGTGSGNSGDLRYCITQVNKDPVTNLDTIRFAIGGPATIALASALPAIITPVTIDGTTEGAFTGVPLVTVDATKVDSKASALEVDSGSSTIMGLSIINSPGTAISLVGNGKGKGDGNAIASCFIGTADGLKAAGNANGIHVIGSSGNVIGGYGISRNVISGNAGHGIWITDPTNGLPSNNNQILGNDIGVDLTGGSALANAGAGIYIDNSSGDVIDRNVITGNQTEGIFLTDVKGICQQITITSNMIGTSADGTRGIGNGHRGIYVQSGSYITIGGVNAGNVIADSGLFNGSTYSGIRLDNQGTSNAPTDHTLIAGNKVGTDITGTVVLSNGYDGIRLLGANDTTIGGTASGAGNLVSGNWVDNIAIETVNGSPLNQNTLVAGNMVGLTGSGDKALGDVQRGRYGIYVTGANGATIGGATPAAGNVISGNIQDGIFLSAGQNALNIQNVLIEGNKIGTDSTGVKPVANRGDGINAGSASGVSIANNVVAGNATNGIVASSTSGLNISGNNIGLNQGSLPAGMNTRASFDGLGFNQSGGYVPPDTIAAVGQKYVVETINTTIRISNKNGGVILEEPLSTFFPQSRYGLYDPSVFYDDNSGRFVVEAMENQFDVFGQPTSTSYINIAFSDLGNEDSFTPKYRITTTEGNSWADYPRFGFNADAIVYEFNMFDASTGEVTGVQLLSIDKSSIGQPQLKTIRVDKGADFTDTPASMHGAPHGGPLYFVQSNNFTAYNGQFAPSSFHVLTWANPLKASSFFSDNELPVPTYIFPNPAEQKGGFPVDTNDFRVLSVAWRDNVLVAANTSAVDGSLVAKAHWYVFKTDVSHPMSIPLVLQTGVIDPGPGVSTFFPAIDINKAGDIGLTYMESSPSEYISMYVTGQIKGDPANTMRPAVLAQAGIAPYVAFDGSPFIPYRQGDFAGMGVDPVNDSFWAANEYATATQPLANYGTWIQQFTLQPTAVNGIYLNLGNSGDGIQLIGVSGAQITGNTISANFGNGINADGGTSGLQVVNNFIGTDPVGDNLGNVGNGISLLGSQNVIGGDGFANTLAFNGVAGILVGGSGDQNSIAFNLIHDNGGLGISLGNGTIPTQNQPNGGSLPGPNNFQNYPVLTSAIVDTPSNTTEIRGILGGPLNPVPTGQYTIQFFSNPTGDASGHGQGAAFLGQTTVSASGGSAAIDFFLPTALSSGLYISAAAIGQSGNTSEFSGTVQTQAKVELNLSGSGSSATVYPGDTLTYTYTVTNQGQNPATQVAFTDVLDPNTAFVSATPAGYSLTGNTLTVNVGDLQPGASATVTVTVLVGPGNRGAFTLSNQGSFTTFDANDPSATTQVPVSTQVKRSADVAITSVVPSVTTSYPTGTVTYTITATNKGPSDSSGGTIQDTIPGLKNGYATFVSSSTGATPDSNGVVTFTFGALKSGVPQTFTVTVSPTDQGVNQALQNSASIIGSDHDPNSTNDKLAGAPVNIIPAVTLVAGLSGSTGTVQVGDPLTYTATVTNTSGVDATGVTLVDTLPSNVVVVSAPAGSQVSGNTITITIGNLPRGQTSAPVTIVVSPTSAALGSPTITNAVQSKANEFVLNATQAQTSVTTNVIDRPGTLGFGSASYSVAETAGSATLTVVRSAGQRGTVTVHYATVAVNATPGMDFTPISGTLTFAAGVASQTIVVPVLANPYDRTNELVNVVLSDVSPAGATLGTSSTATLTIVDTDPNHNNLTVASPVAWSGTGSQITSLNLNFGMPLLPSTANDPGNYTLYAVATGGGVSASGIALSPSYDPSTFVVTLTPSRPLAANQFYQLVVNGTAPNGIQTLAGTMLAGNGTTPGTNYVASLATGTSLQYTTSVGDLVSINIRGGGYLNDVIDASGRGVRLQVVGEVPHSTVLTGTVKKGPHGTGRAYLGYTIYGLGNFGDVSVKMYSPPFQVDQYPLPTATSAARFARATARHNRVAVKAAPARMVTAKPVLTVRVAAPAHRPFHAFHR